MNANAERLVRLLADGEMHSGERLAAELGITRAAVWKIVAELRERDIAVVSHERRGYQLEQSVELLDLQSLRRSAEAACIELPAATEVFFELGSTNEYLHGAVAPLPVAPRLVFAELQTAGRGRRGREWLAPFGSGLTFSIGWTFPEMPADLSALGLALGVCVVRALRELGAADVQLKWPNDIVHHHAKLGGLLLQMRSEAGGPAYVVAGLGLTWRCLKPLALRSRVRSPRQSLTLQRPVAASHHHASTQRAHRGGMLAGLAEFSRSGFASFAGDWAAFDSLRDSPVTVLRHDGPLEGIARGADAEGALRVEIPGGVIERVHAGDVSLRRSLQAEAMAR